MKKITPTYSFLKHGIACTSRYYCSSTFKVGQQRLSLRFHNLFSLDRCIFGNSRWFSTFDQSSKTTTAGLADHSRSKKEFKEKHRGGNDATPSWSEEWKALGLGAQRLPQSDEIPQMTRLLFVQTGVGVDQHGTADATKAAVRAVRNAIEFNSIPGIISVVPGGRKEMLIHVKLGVPTMKDFLSNPAEESNEGMAQSEVERQSEPSKKQLQHQLLPVDLSHVAKVFPYGKILPIEVVTGGLTFSTGRIVTELGDENDLAICCVACVSIGFDDGTRDSTASTGNKRPLPYDTRDGY